MTPPPWAAEVADIVDPGAWGRDMFDRFTMATVNGVTWCVGNGEASVWTEDFEASLNHDGKVPRALRALLRALEAVNAEEDDR